MRKNYLKCKNWLILSLMGLLGFSACRSTKNISTPDKADADNVISPEPVRVAPPESRGEIVLMYGVPTANFHIKGRVVDPKGKPVQNIQVVRLERFMKASPDAIIGDPDNVKTYVDENAVRTATNGSFDINFSSMPSDTVNLQVRDIDGVQNGQFRNRIVPVAINPDDYDGGSGWNAGRVEKEITITLQEK